MCIFGLEFGSDLMESLCECAIIMLSNSPIQSCTVIIVVGKAEENGVKIRNLQYLLFLFQKLIV
jgi:hypothetical protein